MFADLHCHPILKSFGKNNFQPSLSAQNEANLFHHKPLNWWNKLLENWLTLTPYRQSDLYAAFLSQSKLLGLAVYAPERDFFVGKLDVPIIENLISNFGTQWIEKIQDPATSYYDGLKDQFQFLDVLDGQITTIKGKPFQYKIINNKTDLEQLIQSPNNRVIGLFYTVEGGHNLFNFVETQALSSDTIEPDSIDYIKSKSPVYLTLAHHFFNQLTGHCISLPDSLQELRPQKFGSNLGLLPQGEWLIDSLLSRENGPRILIDVKHMNPRARNTYYQKLEQLAAQGDFVPIVFSHGGCNGMASFDNPVVTSGLFQAKEIGFYDNEIIRLIQSKGIFGLNMDERVMSSEEALDATKHITCAKKRYTATSKLIWNHVEHMVRLTVPLGLDPWMHICIGSDYDGIINPVNGFWTLEYLPRFSDYFKIHLSDFLKQNPAMSCGHSVAQIMKQINHFNLTNFMINHYSNNESVRA